jgi:hypothetical protein
MRDGLRLKVTLKLGLLTLAHLALVGLLFAAKPSSSTIDCLHRDVLGRVGDDSSFFIASAWNAFRAHQPIYRTLFFEQHMKFQYPTSSIFLGSFAHTVGIGTYTAVQWIVLLSALLTIFFATEVFLQVLPQDQPDAGYRWKIWLLIGVLGFTFYPLVNSVDLGQIQTLITFLFTLSVWFWLRKQVSAAAICLAVACIFKPQLAVFVLWGLVRKEWRFVGTFTSCFVLIQLVAIGLYGWHNELDYLAVLSYMGHRGEVIFENQSINGWMQREFGNGLSVKSAYFTYPPYNAAIYVVTLLSSSALLLIGLVVPALRGWKSTTSDFILFGMLATMASPIAWTHHYGLFFVGFVYIFAMGLKQTGRISPFIAVCFLVMANFFHFFGRWALNRGVELLFSTVLYAGFGVLFWLSFRMDHDEASAFPLPDASGAGTG